MPTIPTLPHCAQDLRKRVKVLCGQPGGAFEVMQRIAVPMIGGMVSSTLLTLIVIPVLFAMIHGRPLRVG